MRNRIFVDCGTSYAKLYDAETSNYRIIASRELMKNSEQYDIVASTGHNLITGSRNTINELVSLAEGALVLINDPDFTVLDCGARDVKYVQISDRRVTGMDWNTECGAFTGQVIELLTRYFDINPDTMPASADRIPVVCGVLGMTAMFDLISQGVKHEEALAQFLRGVTLNCETLVGRPEKIYLSGGLCDNSAFLNSFSCEVVPLGRFVLVEGLKRITDR